MSHDREHKKLEARLTMLAKTLGWKWVPCPNIANEEGDYPDGELECMDGQVDYGRGLRSCGKCNGAAMVLRSEL